MSADISSDRHLLLFSLIQVIISLCSFSEFSSDTVSTFTQHRKVNVNCIHTKEGHTMNQTWDVSFTNKYSFVYDNDGSLLVNISEGKCSSVVKIPVRGILFLLLLEFY